MACSICEKAEHSFDGRPFKPPNGSIYDLTFRCQCGEMWWQYNDCYNLWSTVADKETFQNILNGCPEPVAIGNPSKNLF